MLLFTKGSHPRATSSQGPKGVACLAALGGGLLFGPQHSTQLLRSMQEAGGGGENNGSPSPESAKLQVQH